MGFDEIRTILTPPNVPNDLISALDELGIPHTTYDGTSEDRIAKLNAVPNVQFSPREVDGKQVVWADKNILKEKPDNQKVEAYIKQYLRSHIGEVYTIIESGYKVYLGKDLPGEYTHSQSTDRLKYKNAKRYMAKMRMASELGEMIEIATNRRWERAKHTHNKDAKYGVYKYTSSIAFPFDDYVDAYNVELVIINSHDGKKYLYDVQNIKKDAALANRLYFKAGMGRKNPSRAHEKKSVNSQPKRVFYGRIETS